MTGGAAPAMLVLLPLLRVAVADVPEFSLIADYTGERFFEGFDFFTASDPTSGCVDFLSEADARAANLTGINAAGQVFMRTDNTTLNPTQGGSNRTARQSVRVSSKRAFDPKTLGGSGSKDTSGSVMVVLDASHMPTGCGVWPAFWMNSVLGTCAPRHHLRSRN